METKIMTGAERAKELGIVGAGGAGFPTYVKLQSKAEIVLVNAAECEPLLHKDKELLAKKSPLFFAGLKLLMEEVGAAKGIIGIKIKHLELINQLRLESPDGVEIVPVDDFYPAGDEITLIYETSGRVIEAGALPITRGIVVNNVETVYNLGKSSPVVTKFINLAGAVKKRVSLEVPIGLSFRELIEFAGPENSKYAVIEGGPMMGRLVTDLSQPVTKTTGGLIVLPDTHVLVRKMQLLNEQKRVNRIGKAACDQCMQCTDLCPRFLLGHPIQPHEAMRSLIFTGEGQLPQSHTRYCCECNLCSFISCPEGLAPSQVCKDNKQRAIQVGLEYQGMLDKTPHPMMEYRKTPSKKLKIMLDLNRFYDEGPLVESPIKPKRLKIALTQHIGKPAKPIVEKGEKVTLGQKVGTVGDGLGAEIHASSDGVVLDVNENYVVLSLEG